MYYVVHEGRLLNREFHAVVWNRGIILSVLVEGV